MRSFIDFSTFANGNTKVEENCFNNENYDCFAYIQEKINKEDEEKTVKVELKRRVSRIAFMSSNNMPENRSIKSITFSKFDFFGTHILKSNSISIQHAGSSTLNLSKFTTENPNYADTKELFYFYTFASLNDGNDVSLYAFNFTVNFDDDSTYETSVDQLTIKPTPNYKIIVKGPFLSAPETKTGNLILDVQSLNTESWENETEVKLDKE